VKKLHAECLIAESVTMGNSAVPATYLTRTSCSHIVTFRVYGEMDFYFSLYLLNMTTHRYRVHI